MTGVVLPRQIDPFIRDLRGALTIAYFSPNPTSRTAGSMSAPTPFRTFPGVGGTADSDPTRTFEAGVGTSAMGYRSLCSRSLSTF